MKVSSDCIFCRIVAGEIPCIRVFEDDLVLSFMDICPLNKGHLLVVPKEHFETILDVPPDLYGRLATVVCRIAKAVQGSLRPDGMNVMQLNGRAGNQVVPHVHLHLVPRWNDDGLTICGWTPIQGDPAEIASTADQIRLKMLD